MFLSIPFIGIFALHLKLRPGVITKIAVSFNSLYWDFCSASSRIWRRLPCWFRLLSIPFIGIFALHLTVEACFPFAILKLSIPFIGIFALHRLSTLFSIGLKTSLSIPFIGIFALHRCGSLSKLWSITFTFNSLYWDFCSASKHFSTGWPTNAVTFNSLYWDFCSASFCLTMPKAELQKHFQFPLLGFLLCIYFNKLSCTFYLYNSFNSLYWDFCSASFSIQRWKVRSMDTFNSLYWDFCSASGRKTAKESWG